VLGVVAVLVEEVVVEPTIWQLSLMLPGAVPSGPFAWWSSLRQKPCCEGWGVIGRWLQIG
jgi:hypothetical protein